MLKLAMPTSSAAEDMYHDTSSRAMTFDSYLKVCTPPSRDSDKVTFDICTSPGTIRDALRSLNDDAQLLQNTFLSFSESCSKRSQSFRVSRRNESNDEESWRSCLSNPSIKLTRAEMPKKKVSFADDAGLNLTRVRLLSGSCDSLPVLGSGSSTPSYRSFSNQELRVSLPVLVASFQQPMTNFAALLQKVEQHSISLESVLIQGCEIRGTVKVKNIAYEKRVFVRYSLNQWNTYTDVECTYTTNNNGSGNNSIDNFYFKLIVPDDLNTNSNVEFALCFCCVSGEFWDNNTGKNYEIITKSATPVPRKSVSIARKRNLCLGI